MTQTTGLVDQPSEHLLAAHVIREGPRSIRSRSAWVFWSTHHVISKANSSHTLDYILPQSDSDPRHRHAKQYLQKNTRFFRYCVSGGRNCIYGQTYYLPPCLSSRETGGAHPYCWSGVRTSPEIYPVIASSKCPHSQSPSALSYLRNERNSCFCSAEPPPLLRILRRSSCFIHFYIDRWK